MKSLMVERRFNPPFAMLSSTSTSTVALSTSTIFLTDDFIIPVHAN